MTQNQTFASALSMFTYKVNQNSYTPRDVYEFTAMANMFYQQVTGGNHHPHNNPFEYHCNTCDGRHIVNTMCPEEMELANTNNNGVPRVEPTVTTSSGGNSNNNNNNKKKAKSEPKKNEAKKKK